jgi:hypothetical protein
MLPNDQWPALVDALLRGSAAQRREARATMWLEVDDFVVSHARLPIGPLGDDEDERRAIAVRVLRTLERADLAQIREWERRQRRRLDAAPWWGFVRMVAVRRAIDHARCSSLNTAPRGQAFAWAMVTPTAPASLAETRVERFVATCDLDALVELLDRLNALRRKTLAAAPPLDAPPAPVGLTGRGRPA